MTEYNLKLEQSGESSVFPSFVSVFVLKSLTVLHESSDLGVQM